MLETSFRIHRDEVTRKLIGCPPTAERQKIGFDPIATEQQLRRNGRWKGQRRNVFFSRRPKPRNSYGIYVTAKRQRNGGNQALVTTSSTLKMAVPFRYQSA